ncbi:MAG: hypothetical protein AAFV72_02370 [Cyanobacteria bacterium J06635_1]
MLTTIKSGIKAHAQLLGSPSLGRMMGLSLGVVAGATLLGLGSLRPAHAEGLHGQSAVVPQARQLNRLTKQKTKQKTKSSTMFAKASSHRLSLAAVTSLDRSHSHQSIQPLLAQRSAAQEVVSTDQALPNDGVYLYGQQPLPNQLATAYLVFEARAGIILGAFYMPQSSFDCVQGQFQDTQLALTVTDSYSQDNFEYALGIERDTQVASTEGAVAMAIEGYHRIQQVSENDLRILDTCKAFYSEEI